MINRSMSRQARHRSYCEVLLPAASAAPSPTFTRRRICGNVSSRICHEPHWLLQRPAGWCAESGDGQAERVMNSAARIVSNTRKFDHGLTHVRHDIVHWLDVPERVTFKLCMTVYKCLHGMGPIYLSEMCRPSSSEAGRRHLRSVNRAG